MKISELKAKYQEQTGIPKEDYILKSWDGKIMEDEKTLRDYSVERRYHNVLELETKSSWFLHFIQSTGVYPELISRNMTEDLFEMYQGVLKEDLLEEYQGVW